MIRKNRINYVNKILREFKSKKWDMTKVWGSSGSIQRASRNKANFEKFKLQVRQARSYFREQENIKKEMDLIREKRKDYQKKRNYERQKSLFEMHGGNSRQVRMIWSNRKELGLTNADYFDKQSLNKKIANKMKKDLENEIMFTDYSGNSKRQRKQGSFFKKHSEDYFVEEQLKALYKLIKQDKNAMENIVLAQNYLYDTIIPMKYEGRNPEYSKFKHADDKFWEDVSKQLVNYYKTLMR